MELIYSNQLDGFDPDKRYRNPDLFRSIERDATKVIVVGDYPEIVDAYKAAEVEVTSAKLTKPKQPLAGKIDTKGATETE